MNAADATRRGGAWLPAAGLALLVALAFAPSLGNGFVDYDDDLYITRNPHITGGLSAANVAWAFTSFHGANWFPLTRLSWMLDVSLFGLDPRAFHALSLALHAATAVVLFAALERLTRERGLALFASAAFALHPLRVESVAWASYRRDVLAGLCFAAALLAYARARAAPERAARGLGFATPLWLAAGLLSKPTLVTLPGVLLLLDFWPLGRLQAAPGGPIEWRRLAPLLREKLPLFALVALHAAIAVAAQASAGAVQSLEQIPLGQRVANALVSVFAYLGQTVWPSGLSPFYPHPGASLPPWQALAAALGLAAVTSACLASARRAPQLAVGWLWFLLMLAPVIGIVQVGAQARADRYTYLPQIGLWLALAWSARDLVRGRAWLARAAAAGAALALLAFSAVTAAQCRVWRDTETLFAHALALAPNNHIAHINLAEERVAQGRPGAARAHAEQALAIAPESAFALAALAQAAALEARWAEAEAHFRRALERQPGQALWRGGLAAALRGQGRLREAVAEYERALAAAPEVAELHANLGLALHEQGRPEAALAAFERALALDPGLGPAHGYRAVALEERGESEAALAAYRRSLALAPGQAALRARYGRLLAERGDPEAGIAELEASLRLASSEPGVHALLAALLQRGGRESGAIDHYRSALALGARTPELLNDLAWLLATAADPALRRPAEALRLASEAVSLRRDSDLLDTLAAAHFASGDAQSAARVQREALAQAEAEGRAQRAGELRETLARYEQGSE